MSKVEEVRDVVGGGSVGVEPFHHAPVRRVHLRVPMYNVLVLGTYPKKAHHGKVVKCVRTLLRGRSLKRM